MTDMCSIMYFFCMLSWRHRKLESINDFVLTPMILQHNLHRLHRPRLYHASPSRIQSTKLHSSISICRQGASPCCTTVHPGRNNSRSDHHRLHTVPRRTLQSFRFRTTKVSAQGKALGVQLRYSRTRSVLRSCIRYYRSVQECSRKAETGLYRSLPTRRGSRRPTAIRTIQLHNLHSKRHVNLQ